MNYQEICHQHDKNLGQQQKLESQLKRIKSEMITAHRCGLRHLWASLNKQLDQLSDELIQLMKQELDISLAKKKFKEDSSDRTPPEHA